MKNSILKCSRQTGQPPKKDPIEKENTHEAERTNPTAFEIYERMSRLESALWGQYYKEFLEIIMAEEDVESRQNNDQFNDVFNLLPEK